MTTSSSRRQWLAPLADQERELAAKRAALHDKVRVILADGVRYELRADDGSSPRGFSLKASRDAVELWATSLPAASMGDGMPFAAGGGSVVVAGLDLRSRRRLRLIGIDAATGAIRYVRRHPSTSDGATEVALSGDVAFVAWAQELRGYEAATGKLLWRTGAD